jgi:hypothetical protein
MEPWWHHLSRATTEKSCQTHFFVPGKPDEDMGLFEEDGPCNFLMRIDLSMTERINHFYLPDRLSDRIRVKRNSDDVVASLKWCHH